MPKLRKYKDGHGYYVLGQVPGTASISTWQITPAGVARLRSAGYSGDDIFFSPKLLKELIDRGDATTGKSGVGLPLPTLIVSHERASTIQPPAVSLIFVEEVRSWRLALQIARLPRSWIQEIEDLTTALSNWKIIVPGATPVPATRLYPGRGGALIPVRPQQGPYTISAEGTWPLEWNVRSWLVAPTGLEKDLTLFRGDSGVRLPEGSLIEPGETYTLVVPFHLAADLRKSPPAVLLPESLGQVDQWRAWSIQIPVEVDEQILSWCKRAGFRVAEPRSKLNLVTPPSAYTHAGQAIITVDEELVLALTPQQRQEGGEVNFFTVCFKQTGAFCINVENSVATPIHVVVETPSTLLQPLPPAPLTLRIHWGEHTFQFNAFRDTSGPHQLAHPTISKEQALYVEVICDTPINLTLDLGDNRRQLERLSTDEAGSLITEMLQAASRRKVHLSAQIDGGVFGRLRFVLPALSVMNDATISLPPETLRRARWLAVVLPALTRSAPTVPIPISTRHIFTRIAELPGCATLNNLYVVPTTLLPVVRAIARVPSKINGKSNG